MNGKKTKNAQLCGGFGPREGRLEEGEPGARKAVAAATDRKAETITKADID